MKKELKISVIVTIYNLEEYLEECIESILEQTYKNLEIILVDDGSTDQSPAICDRYKELDARVIAVHKKNGGLVNARKEGVRIATGDYIAFVDGDDWIDSEMYQIFAEEIKSNQSEIVVQGYVKNNIETCSQVTNYISEGYYDKKAMEKLVYPIMLCVGNWYEFGVTQFVWNKVFKATLLKTVMESVDENITDGEDVALVFPMMLKAISMSVIDACHYHYREVASSMCRKKSDDYYSRILYLKRNLEKTLLVSKYRSIMEPQLHKFILHMLFNGLKTIYGVDASVNMSGETFDFSGISPQDEIVLYGAGKYGQACFKQIIQNENCFVKAWVDKNSFGTKLCSCLIKEPREILKMKYDAVYIAIKNKDTAKEIKQELLSLGVPGEKIIWRKRVTAWDSFTVR